MHTTIDFVAHLVKPRQVASILPAFALLAGISASSTSMASVRDIRFDQEKRQVMVETIAPGKALELCGDMQNGAHVGWRFDSDKALDFNIHFHVGKEVQYPSKLKARKNAAGRLDVNQDQTYCWMWSNRGQHQAKLSVTLEDLK